MIELLNKLLFLLMNNILLTTFLTVLSGVLVYVTGQIIIKFFLEPIYKQKEVIGEIKDSLIFYAEVYANPEVGSKEKKDEVSNRFRLLSASLYSKTSSIPLYSYLEKIRVVMNSVHIDELHKELIGLSNSVYSKGEIKNILARRERIENLLYSLKVKNNGEMENHLTFKSYSEFIVEWSHPFIKYFPFYLSVFASVLIGIYLPNFNVNTNEPFDVVLALLSSFLTLQILFYSLLIGLVVLSFFTLGFGTILYFIGKINLKIYKKHDSNISLIVAIIVLLLGLFFWRSSVNPSIQIIAWILILYGTGIIYWRIKT